MAKQLLAKDKRRWKHRKLASVALAIGGGTVLAVAGWWLIRKITVDRPPAPGETKDWSGCFPAPDWVQPKPQFSCGQRVVSETYYGEGAEPGVDSVVTARTWTASTGTWQYSLLFSGDIYEEGQLTAA